MEVVIEEESQVFYTNPVISQDRELGSETAAAWSKASPHLRFFLFSPLLKRVYLHIIYSLR